MGGAHRDPAAAIRAVGEMMAEVLEQLVAMDWQTVRARRQEKFLSMGNQPQPRQVRLAAE